jgi:tRNA(Ile)-lysidine synthase
MIAQFIDFIKKHALFDQRDNILIAFSGGIDSAVLVDLFHKAGFKFALAHCNFTLRGQESDIDEETAKSVAEIYRVPIFIRKFNTAEHARSHKISIEMAARELRYGFFEEVMNQGDYDRVATAHHLGDVLETILLNLSKGTGISGVRGILPKQNRVIRPILFASKSMLLKYADENQLKWREDISNELDVYQRNLIRNQVVPQLLKINPNLFETLSRTIAKLRFAEKIFLDHISKAKGDLLVKTGDDILISKAKLAEQDAPALLLSEIIKEYGFNFDQCASIMDSINQTGAVFLSANFRLNIDRENILISATGCENDDYLTIDSSVVDVDDQQNVYSCKVFDARGYTVKKGRETACLDFDLLKFPILVRKWRTGDKFMPLGMKNKKKLSDFMIDEKIPLNLKRRLKVLESAGEVVWIIGHRIDERYKISSETRKIYEITVRKK